MMVVAENEVLVDEIINFNGPEDDSDDVFEDDDFELDEIDSIGEFGDFEDEEDDF